jgi:hypothetical protein
MNNYRYKWSRFFILQISSESEVGSFRKVDAFLLNQGYNILKKGLPSLLIALSSIYLGFLSHRVERSRKGGYRK